MKKIAFLNANTLKMIALVSMILDHVGYWLYPEVTVLRILGRIAFPVYAFMIAEGARHTRNLTKYFLRVFALGAFCQAFVIVGSGLWVFTVLITLALSLALILCFEKFRSAQGWKWKVCFALLFALVLGLGVFLSYPPEALYYRYELSLDYGVIGMLVPFLLYLCPKKEIKLLALTAMLVLLAYTEWSIQYYALCAVPLLLLYNGERGKYNLKPFFYLAYPVHLGIILGIYYFL